MKGSNKNAFIFRATYCQTNEWASSVREIALDDIQRHCPTGGLIATFRVRLKPEWHPAEGAIKKGLHLVTVGNDTLHLVSPVRNLARRGVFGNSPSPGGRVTNDACANAPSIYDTFKISCIHLCDSFFFILNPILLRNKPCFQVELIDCRSIQDSLFDAVHETKHWRLSFEDDTSTNAPVSGTDFFTVADGWLFAQRSKKGFNYEQSPSQAVRRITHSFRVAFIRQSLFLSH